MANLFTKIKRLVKKDENWKTDVWIIGAFLLIIFGLLIWQPELPTEQEIRNFADRFGSYGPLAIIGIIIIETVIAPIPGTIVPIAIGVLYGLWPGFLYAWLGNIIGATIAFFIARHLGRPIVKKIIKEKTIDHYDKFLHRNKLFLWMFYLVPVFPLDTISFVIGLSALKFRQFILIVGIGLLVDIFILTYFGERLLVSSGLERALYAVVIMVIFIVALVIERRIVKKGKIRT